MFPESKETRNQNTDTTAPKTQPSLQPWEEGLTLDDIARLDAKLDNNNQNNSSGDLSPQLNLESKPKLEKSEPKPDTKLSWEEGLTPERLRELDKNREEEIKKERESERERRLYMKRFNRFENFMRPLLPNHFNVLIFDLFHGRVDINYLEFYCAAFSCFAFCFTVSLLSLLWFPLPLFIYTYIMFTYQHGRGIPTALFVYFICNHFFKMFKGTGSQPIYRRQDRPDRFAVYEFYFSLIFILVGSVFAYGTEYGEVVKGVWVLVVVLILARHLPGVGANSWMGVAFFLILVVISTLTIPEMYRRIITTTRDVMLPFTEPTVAPIEPFNFAAYIDKNFSLHFGIATNSWLDLTRKFLSYVPVLWCVMDDLMGPGIALSVATDIKAKRELRAAGSSGIYTGWWYLIIVELFALYLTNNMLSFLVIILSSVVSWTFWNHFGKPCWESMGQGVLLTDVRPGFRFVFGDGPHGLRLGILRLCTLSVSMCLMLTHHNNVAVTFLFLTTMALSSERAMGILIGLMSLNFSLLIRSFFNKHPITGEMRSRTADAYVHPPLAVD